MAIFRLDKQWFENLTVQARPKRHFSSASLNSSQNPGIEGSVYVFSERSKFEKEAQALQAFSDGTSTFGDNTLEGYRQEILASVPVGAPAQIQQITQLTFTTKDPDSTLAGGAGLEGTFDYRDLLGHSSYEYIENAYFDLYEPSGIPRRFYFYNSLWGDTKKKPGVPDRGSRHMIDLKDLSSIGDPSLPSGSYDVDAALQAVGEAVNSTINSVTAFSSSYGFAASTPSSTITVTNTRYGDCEEPISGTILNPITGLQVLDLDLDADGVGDQDLPTFPYNIFNIEVTEPGTLTTINGMLDNYLSLINNSEVSSRKQTAVNITRFEPSFKLTSDTLRKNAVKDMLFPYYRTKYADLHWAYTNYNTINFFTSSLVPEDTALVYPSFTDETTSPSTIPYSPSGSFTFEFYINPRYTIDEVDSYASGSFMVYDWEKLLIDFHGGGRGAHDSSWDTDFAYDDAGDLYWYETSGDSTDWRTAVTWGFADDAAIEADGNYSKAENLVTDKGDEAPDYDFRSGDPITKICKIVLNNGVSSGDVEFEFSPPGSIKNASDWTIGKNELGDYDNFETAKNIAKTIDGNQYFKSWAEKIEVVDEVGQQRVDIDGITLLWTDDNGLSEYTEEEALDNDGASSRNDYQATSSGHLLWNDGIDSFTAESKGYGEIVAWDNDGVIDTPAGLGYTEYYDPTTFLDVEGPFDTVSGEQRWVNPAVDITTYFLSVPGGYTGYYDGSDPTFPDVLGVDYDPAVGHLEWSIQQWADFRGYRKFPVAYTAVEWSEEAWALRNEYSAVYHQTEAGPLAVGLPEESAWMTGSGYVIEYTNYLSEAEWAEGQGYEPVIVYEPTLVYGKVWVQTLIPGWDGNVATTNITTTQQTVFSWYAWEEAQQYTLGPDTGTSYSLGFTGWHDGANNDVEPDDPGAVAWAEVDWVAHTGAVAGAVEWSWVKKYEVSSVDEDAKQAFRDSLGEPLLWSAGPEYVVDIPTLGGRDHVVVDRTKSHQFNAGTVMHMSSSYAISLVTGSHIDKAGHPDTYRIMLQLSSSADIPPSEIPTQGYTNGDYGGAGWNYPGIESGKIYLSSDNSLQRNEWHHVAIRWGTDLIDASKAQILINGELDSEFNIPEEPLGIQDLSIPQEFGDITPKKSDDFSLHGGTHTGHEDTDIEADPAALFIGNYFEGKNAAKYMQLTSYVDADGNPTIEGDHVAEKYGWNIQEVNDDGLFLWSNNKGISVVASDTGFTDAELRDAYLDAITTYTLDELQYTPILSSTLAYNITDLIAEFTLPRVFDQALAIDSDNTQYLQGLFSYESSIMNGVTWGRLDDVDSEAGWTPEDPDPLEPNDYQLRHPLNAEVHELKVWNEYRTIPQLDESMKDGHDEIEDTLLFYLPPFFTKETRERDVMVTPFQSITSTTDDPFNVAMSFGVGGHLLNLENFCREFVKGEHPLLLNLSGSTIDTTSSEDLEANELLNKDPQIRKRNLTILPCDNGLFVPGFALLASGTFDTKPEDYPELPTSKFVNDYGTLDYSKVSLRNMVPEDMMYPGLIAVSADGSDDTSPDSIFAEVAGASPENPGVAPGSVLSILQRTRDTSSNEVVFFDSSNLFYGKKINPRSFVLTDPDVTGSGDKVKVTLKDNGFGVLYRADSSSKNATWSTVGNIIYEEGIAVVTNPTIPYFGKEQFSVDMEGVHNVHVMEVMVPCSAGMVNSSSNPNFESLKASLFASDEDTDFVYITGLNFHDENLNIVARTNLAQPVVKRDADSIAFRIKVDF